MRFTTLILLAGAFTALASHNRSAAADAQWIWGTANAQVSAPAGACEFRKTFDAAAPQSAVVEICCDNRYLLSVNGRRVGEGQVWGTLDRYEIAPLLKPGANTLEVQGVNEGVSPAGLLVRVTLKNAGQALQEVVSDVAWQARTPAHPAWSPVQVLGPFPQLAPWGATPKPAAQVKTASNAAPQKWSGPFQLVAGDRVVLLGGTLVEREPAEGYWEMMLTTAYPKHNLTFRNLGWSGDTPLGLSRARFGAAQEGFAHLEKHVRECRPTVILVAYGAAEAHAGEAALPAFERDMARLLDLLESTGARLVLLAPLKQEHLGPPLPDPTAYNQNVALYGAALETIAEQRGALFVDLNSHLPTTPALTDNAVHFTPFGYWRSAAALAEALRLSHPRWRVQFDAGQAGFDAVGTSVSEVANQADALTFTAQDTFLPRPLPPRFSPPNSAEPPVLKVRGLPAGKYRLTIDDQPAAEGDAAAWAAGVSIAAGPQAEQVEKLRAAIQRKNELFFHRWRPQNETYLYLFRKHEQGNNAAEIPQFDPLIAQLEAEIAQLRQPLPRKYRLTKVE